MKNRTVAKFIVCKSAKEPMITVTKAVQNAIAAETPIFVLFIDQKIGRSPMKETIAAIED